jgi:hypothetical protein
VPRSGREWRLTLKWRRQKMEWQDISRGRLLILLVHLCSLYMLESYTDARSQITPEDFEATVEDSKAEMDQDRRQHGIPGCVFLFGLYGQEYCIYISSKSSTWGGRSIFRRRRCIHLASGYGDHCWRTTSSWYCSVYAGCGDDSHNTGKEVECLLAK